MSASSKRCNSPKSSIAFKVVRVLGETANTSVRLTEHPTQQSSDLVVVKTVRGFSFRRYFGSRADCPVRQLLEAQLTSLRRLRHPNIIQPIEIIDDPQNNQMHQVSPSVGKTTLIEVSMKDGTCPQRVEEGRVAFVALRILSALRYLHRHGFVHGALKPSNVLTDDDGGVYVCDVGGSRWAFLPPSQPTRPSDAGETPWSLPPDAIARQLMPLTNHLAAFSAPEIWTGGGHSRASALQPAVDVWSLGVLMYTMISGRTPHEIVHGLLHQRDVTKVHLPLPSIVSANMKDCLSRMIVVDPQRRASVEELRRHAFFTEAANRSVPSLTPSAVVTSFRRFALSNVYCSQSTEATLRKAASMSPLPREIAQDDAPKGSPERTGQEPIAPPACRCSELPPSPPHDQKGSTRFARSINNHSGAKRAWRRVCCAVRFVMRLRHVLRTTTEYCKSFSGLIPRIVVESPPPPGGCCGSVTAPVLTASRQPYRPRHIKHRGTPTSG